VKKIKDENLFRLVRNYLTVYLTDQKCCSPNTVKAYREALNLLFDFIKCHKQIPLSGITFEILDSQMVSEFLEWLEKERDCCIATRNHRLACIRSFFSYAGKMDPSVIAFHNELMKVPLKKHIESKTVDFLTENALKAILQQPDTSTNAGIRNLFFMILLYDTGARDREILDMKLKDISTTSQTPSVYLTGKGRKIRIVPIMQKTVSHYQNYRNIFHESTPSIDDQYLFYTLRHGDKQQMSDDNVSRFLKIYGKRAKEQCCEVPERVHPHQFRHARAMHLYRSGMPLALLSEWLGHANLETTMIYAYADTEMKRKAIQKATGQSNPLNSEKELPIWRNDDDLIRKLYGLK
jgi:integrase/recombinase XerD